MEEHDFDCSTDALEHYHLETGPSGELLFVKHPMKCPSHFNAKCRLQEFNCTKCKYKTTSTLRCKTHKTTPTSTFDCSVNAPEPHICQYCNFETDYKVHFINHFTKCPKSFYFDDATQFSCETCGFNSFSKALLEMHLCIRLKEKLKCNICDREMKYLHALRRHIFDQHSQSGAWFECEQCEYRAKQKYDLKIHVYRRHMGVHITTRIKCKKCDFVGASKSKLRRHMIHRHLKEDQVNWFDCDKCDYRSKRKDCLDRHVFWKHK